MSISKDATSTMATDESSQKCSDKGRASKFFGVAKYRGKKDAYSAAVYDKEKGRRVHLGSFVDEEEAARARDIASFKCSGEKARYNFPMSDYEEILKLMENMTREEVVTNIRRCSFRFARAIDSDYRGVARTEGRWKALKRVGNEVYYLGSFGTPEEAAMAYDVETIKVKGWNALTNFHIKLYNVEAILAESETTSSVEDRAKFIKKQLLDMPKKYTKGKGKQFLEQIGRQFRVETTGPGETSNFISLQTLNSAENQLCDTANVEGGGTQIEMLVERSLQELPPYHFPAGAGRKFRHSSSSSFNPYKKADLV